MPATTQATCPSWCTTDHEAGDRQKREQFDELTQRGLYVAGDPQADQELAEWIEMGRSHHQMKIGGSHPRCVEIDQDGDEIHVLGETADGMSSAEAREYAKNLLLAADKLDEIVGVA